MLGDACGHRRRCRLPASFVGALAQGSMGVMKIVAQRANPTECIMPIRPTRKRRVLRPFRALRIRSVRLKRSMALVLAFVSPSALRPEPSGPCQNGVGSRLVGPVLRADA